MKKILIFLLCLFPSMVCAEQAVLTSLHSRALVTTENSWSVHLAIQEISANTTFTVIWGDMEKVEGFGSGSVDLTPVKYDKNNGHTFYGHWIYYNVEGIAGNVKKRPGFVQILTDDNSTGWLEIVTQRK